MFGYNPFYFRTLRKCAIAFGSLFNNMVLVKYTTDTLVETQRLTVPLSYYGKENFIQRLYDNPTLAKPVEITLPRASFAITSYKYNPERKLSQYNQTIVPGSSTTSAQSQYQPAPWDLGIHLGIYVRNREDGTQLFEQIVPFFNPDYTVTIDYIPEMGISRNTPIILNDASCDEAFEGDAVTEERAIVWNYEFTMQTYMFGPISSGKIILQANTNLYSFPTIGGGQSNTQLELVLTANGLSNYQIGETVYQGTNLADSNTFGTVEVWDSTNHRLILTNTTGTFIANANVIGSITDASWQVTETPPDVLEVTITDVAVPNTANASTDYGFSETITEFPETI